MLYLLPMPTLIFSGSLALSTQGSIGISRIILYLYSVPEYYELGINFTPSDAETRHNALSDTGAFVAYSGSKTGYII